MALASMSEIFERMARNGQEFWEVVLADDMDERQVSREASMAKMLTTWQAMQESADSYTGRKRSVSGLVGGDGMKMRQYTFRGCAMTGGYVSEVIAEALSMAESNACMRRIVAAPTAGACGVLPAVLLPLCKYEELTQHQLVDTLAVAAEGTTVAGTGHAGLVCLLARGCTVSLAADKTDAEYDPMLRGVDTLTTDPVPALSPECRAVDLYVTYRYFPSEYQTAPGEATLIWSVDGVQQPTRHYTLDGKSITPGFHVEESVWKRDMPTQHTVEILFLCGTDAIRTTFVVPVNNYTDAEYDQLLSAQYPYKLEVVRNQCTVLVYGLDMSGDYSILYHAFVCGPGQTTPIGTFRTPFKAAWHPLMGCWGQYCTQITGNYLFHSSPYNSPNKNDLSYRLYNQLGTVCSHGCVRLTVADAKWIYDNCPLGTTVSIYNASSLPVPKPSAPWLDISSPNRGWDPTDPDPANPWNR